MKKTKWLFAIKIGKFAFVFLWDNSPRTYHINEESMSISDLSKKLDISERDIQYVLCKKEMFYLPVILTKEDGSDRNAYNVLGLLKKTHSRIKKIFFDKPNLYPHYLHGGIRNRSIVTNARTHLRAKSLIVVDMEEYFPSITKKHVRDWFCKHGDKDADLLSDLLTYKDQLPQGACTSSALANFVLFEEREMAKKFEGNGYWYSRYVDDIAVSSKKGFSDDEAEEIQREIAEVVTKNNFSIHSRKTKIYHAHTSPADNKDNLFMVVTGVRVDGKKPRIPLHFYNEIKRTITNLSDYHKNKKIIDGKIAYVKQIEPEKAEVLKKLLSKRLQKIEA